MRISKMALAVGAVAALTSAVAFAGYKYGWEVGVDTVNRNAYGSMGHVRNSVDSTQYIGCSVRTYSSGTTSYVYCSAQDASGNYASCQSSAANMVSVASSINGDSHIYFSWDTSGNCTYLYVNTGSQYAPKNP